MYRIFVKTTVFFFCHSTPYQYSREKERASEREQKKARERERENVRVLYVTLVSLKRATYIIKTKGKNMLMRANKGWRRKDAKRRRDSEETSKRPYVAKHIH